MTYTSLFFSLYEIQRVVMFFLNLSVEKISFFLIFQEQEFDFKGLLASISGILLENEAEKENVCPGPTSTNRLNKIKFSQPRSSLRLIHPGSPVQNYP